MSVGIKLQPREYQARLVDEAVSKIMDSNIKGEVRPIIVASATASGKSLMIAMLADRLGGNVLVLQPSVELLKQNSDKMRMYTDDIGVYSASAGSKTKGKVTMATLGSIKDVDFSEYETLILDEADAGYPTESSKSVFMRFVSANKFKNIIGFTATPFKLQAKMDWKAGRSKQKVSMLTRIPTKGSTRFGTFFWKEIVGKIESKELLDMGYISEVQYFAEKPARGDILKLNSTGNDYTKDSMEEFGSLVVWRAKEVIENLSRYKEGILVFMPSVDSADELTGALQKAGLTAASVNGKTPKKERELIINGFKSGKIQVLVNVSVLLAGFDYPDLKFVVNARPTLSVRTWIQQVGRLQRIATGKAKGFMFDISGTALMFGKAEDIRLAKEGYKDALVCERGRLDEVVLAEYDINTTRKKKLPVSSDKETEGDPWADI